jgi:HEPN domain-containing protein
MELKLVEKHWIDSSNDALDTARLLANKKKFTHSMFFLHLAVEKMLKALFANRNEAEPVVGHNLPNLASKIKDVDFPHERLELLIRITSFNIEARYNDYEKSFYKACDKKFSEEYLALGSELLEWLKSQLR